MKRKFIVPSAKMSWYKKFYWIKVPPNQKGPREKNWPNEAVSHEVAQAWVKEGFNIGLLHGKGSKTMAVDVDDVPLFEEMFGNVNAYVADTLTIKSKKGYHLIYKWEEGLRNLKLDFGDFLYKNKISLAPPSIVDGFKREWVTKREPAVMPKQLQDYIKKKMQPDIKVTFDMDKQVDEMFKVSEGKRNDHLTAFAGLARHIIKNGEEFASLVYAYNRKFNNPPLPVNEVEGMLRKQFDYKRDDLPLLKNKILCLLLNSPEPLHWKDIAKECCLKGEVIRKVLKQMVEDYEVIKFKNGRFTIPEKPVFVKIKDITNIGEVLDFKIKYFNDVAYFYSGDILLISAKSKSGKTHIAMNFAKDFLAQGVPTYYYYTETGGRFKKIADKLGGCEELQTSYLPNPERIVIMPNAVNILDWLMIEDKAQTDIVFRKLSSEMQMKGGFLIVFMQLKEDGNYFAPNMVMQFPALCCRFFHEDEERINGYFVIDANRDPKTNQKKLKVKYNPETLELTENILEG